MTPYPPRLLLVEDNPNDLELALHAFSRSDIPHIVDVVRDGAEALEYLRGTARHAGRDPAIEPRVVLLDVKLPLVDGMEVLRAMKADPAIRHLPVVMLTSSAEDRDLRTCYELGANSYIVKPVDMDRFFASVAQIGAYWLMLNESASPDRAGHL